MNRSLYAALSALCLVGTLTVPPFLFSAQGSVTNNVKEQQFLIRLGLHESHLGEFKKRLSEDARLRSEAQREGQDAAFAEWMRQAHPELYAFSCLRMAKMVAEKFKGTKHMADFDALLSKRADLRQAVERLGHEVIFADWLRAERPKVYAKLFDANLSPPKRKQTTTNKKGVTGSRSGAR